MSIISDQLPLTTVNYANAKKMPSVDSNSKDFSTYFGEENKNLLESRLVTSGTRMVKGGYINYSVYSSENSTPENPIFLVMGKDVSGKEFKQEIAINKIDPNNASLIEMLALQGHAFSEGLPPMMMIPNWFESSGKIDFLSSSIFEKFDFLGLLINHMETQRQHGNNKSFDELTALIDEIMRITSQKR